MARKRRRRRQKPPPITQARQRSSTYKRWCRWLKVIEHDVMSLALSRYVYREIGAMVQANPDAQAPSYFWAWLARVYVNDASVSVRRLMDWDRRVVSMLKLLQEIEDHPEVMSRRRIRALHKGRPQDQERAVANFIKPGDTTLDAARIRRLRRELVDAHARVRGYVNTHVAHRQRRPIRQLPTFGEVHAAIDVVTRALKECTLLLTGAEFFTVVPDLPHTWKNPFRVAWLRD